MLNMEAYDKAVKNHCCLLTPAERLKTGFKTKTQLKRSIENIALNPEYANDGAFIGANVNEVIAIINPVSISTYEGISLKGQDIPNRPVNIQGEPAEELQGLARTVTAESVRSELEEVALEIEEKMDRGELPTPQDLNRVEQLERLLAQTQQELQEARFLREREKELTKIAVEEEMRTGEELSQLELRRQVEQASKEDLLRYIQQQRFKVANLTAGVPPKERQYESQLERASAKKIANYYLETLRIDPKEIVEEMKPRQLFQEPQAGEASTSGTQPEEAVE